MKLQKRQMAAFLTVVILNAVLYFLLFNAFVGVIGFGGNDVAVTFYALLTTLVVLFNSFLWNKFFVFKNQDLEESTLRYQIRAFLFVSILGIVMSEGIPYFFVFALSETALPLSAKAIVNLSGLLGTLIALTSNFFGYRMFVFGKESGLLVMPVSMKQQHLHSH
ncbi:MAG: GtrA family protein [Candidatus Paceibacterota bacterium]|jgi:putative flippase GtrA